MNNGLSSPFYEKMIVNSMKITSVPRRKKEYTIFFMSKGSKNSDEFFSSLRSDDLREFEVSRVIKPEK
ncbi:MAG: hypothetical protein CW742_04145 [Methanoregula sp.]|nr:MAG: hypothetical protein CW742_04145 [Methanoregula sp.]